MDVIDVILLPHLPATVAGGKTTFTTSITSGEARTAYQDGTAAHMGGTIARCVAGRGERTFRELGSRGASNQRSRGLVSGETD